MDYQDRKSDGSNILRLEMLLLEILQELKKDNQQTEAKQWPITLDANQATEYSGISKSKLYQYARMPGFPAIRDETNCDTGGRVFFSRDGLTEWVRANEGKAIR